MTDISKDDEHAAREWLDGAENDMRLGADFRRAKYTVSDNWKHRATILRLLDRPVLPRGEDVLDEVLGRMANAIFGRAHLNNGEAMRAAINILHTHLTAPPQPIEAWAVVWTDGTRQAFFEYQYAQREAGRSPGSRVVKLVEAADDQ